MVPVCYSLRATIPAARPSGATRPRVARHGRCIASASQDDEDRLGDTQGFQRTANQQQLAKVDKAVREARDNLGKGILQQFGGALKAVGIGGTGKGQGNVWETQYKALCAQTSSISAPEAEQLMRKGWVLLDVSPTPDYELHHPAGAVNAPLVQYITGTRPVQLLRKGLYAAQAVKPIEVGAPANPDFLRQTQALIEGAPGVITACAAGGTLQSTTNFPSGQPSRSLIAAYKILEDGNTNVRHLRGGLNTWFRSGFDGEGTGEWDDQSGRTPSAAGYTPTQDSDELR